MVAYSCSWSFTPIRTERHYSGKSKHAQWYFSPTVNKIKCKTTLFANNCRINVQKRPMFGLCVILRRKWIMWNPATYFLDRVYIIFLSINTYVPKCFSAFWCKISSYVWPFGGVVSLQSALCALRMRSRSLVHNAFSPPRRGDLYTPALLIVRTNCYTRQRLPNPIWLDFMLLHGLQVQLLFLFSSVIN